MILIISLRLILHIVIINDKSNNCYHYCCYYYISFVAKGVGADTYTGLASKRAADRTLCICIILCVCIYIYIHI